MEYEAMVEKMIGKRIQERRKSRGITQESLAEMIGVSTNHMSALERGNYKIQIDTLVKIMNILECSADEIFCDVIKNGCQVRASKLSDMLDDIPVDEQRKIFEVVELMVSHAKNAQ